MTTYLRKILLPLVAVVAVAAFTLVLSRRHTGKWALSPTQLNAPNPFVENTRKADAYGTNVIIAYAPVNAPDGIRFQEYSINIERYENLPVWIPENSDSRSFPMSLEVAIDIAQKHILERYGIRSDKMHLSGAGLGYIGDRNEGRWFYTVLFNVNTTSRPDLIDPCENTILTTIVLMDGSVVDPVESELIESKSSCTGTTSPLLVNATCQRMISRR